MTFGISEPWGNSRTRAFLFGLKGNIWTPGVAHFNSAKDAAKGIWGSTVSTWTNFKGRFKERPVYTVLAALFSPFMWVAGAIQYSLDFARAGLKFTVDATHTVCSGAAAVVVDVYNVLSAGVEKLSAKAVTAIENSPQAAPSGA